jgi:hypothetical protein
MVMPLKTSAKEQTMNYRYLYSIFRSSGTAPFMIGAGLMVSGSLIVGLANADMSQNTHKRGVFKAKKLDVNNDGFISLEELTSSQKIRFQKMDRDDDGQIDKAEFTAPLVAMFNRIDRNRDGMLDDNEISKLKNKHHGKRL